MPDVRVKILVSFSIDERRYQGGTEVVMGSAAAKPLAQAGFLKVLGLAEKQAVKILNPPESKKRKSVKVRHDG